jgi:hypothetical protein
MFSYTLLFIILSMRFFSSTLNFYIFFYLMFLLVGHIRSRRGYPFPVNKFCCSMNGVDGCYDYDSFLYCRSFTAIFYGVFFYYKFIYQIVLCRFSELIFNLIYQFLQNNFILWIIESHLLVFLTTFPFWLYGSSIECQPMIDSLTFCSTLKS